MIIAAETERKKRNVEVTTLVFLVLERGNLLFLENAG